MQTSRGYFIQRSKMSARHWCQMTQIGRKSAVLLSNREWITKLLQHGPKCSLHWSGVRFMSSGRGWLSNKEIAIKTRTTLNDLPVPQGSWRENYTRLNRRRDVILGAAVATFGVTLISMHQAGVFYFHGRPDYKKVTIDFPSEISKTMGPPKKAVQTDTGLPLILVDDSASSSASLPSASSEMVSYSEEDMEAGGTTQSFVFTMLILSAVHYLFFKKWD